MQAQTLKPFSPQPRGGQRAVGGTLVIALHIGLVAALVVGLAPPDFVQKIVKDIIVVDLPPTPPPPVDPTVKPVDPIDTTVRVVEPIVDIDDTATSAGPTITATLGQGGGNQVAALPTPARGIMNTHTIPPYPPISIRLNEQGNVTLQVRISETGAVEEAVVTRSSGYPRLDDAAVAWVKSHWRYRAAEQGGRPVASSTTAVVKFELRNAR